MNTIQNRPFPRDYLAPGPTKSKKEDKFQNKGGQKYMPSNFAHVALISRQGTQYKVSDFFGFKSFGDKERFKNH